MAPRRLGRPARGMAMTAPAGNRKSLGGGDWLIDGQKYVVVCVNGALFRVAKRRVGLMRFGHDPVYSPPMR